MKKKLIAASIVIICAAGYTAASWYTGNIIENRIDDEIRHISAQINQTQKKFAINMQYSQYHKGIFSTSFNLKIDAIDEAEPEQGNVLFNDIVTIYHGPLPWSELQSASFYPKMAAFVYQNRPENNEQLWLAAGNNPFITVNGSMDYSSNIDLTLHNEPIDYTNEELNLTVKTGKNDLIASINNQFNSIDIDSHIEQLSLNTDGDGIDIQNFVFAGQLSKQDNTNYQSTGRLSLEQGSITNNSIKNLMLKQLTSSIDLSRQTNSIVGNIVVAVNELEYGLQNLGKGELSTNYHLKLENNQISNWQVKLDNFLWQTAQGDLAASFDIDLEADTFNLDHLNEDNLIFAQAKASIPLKPLAYLAAQVNNPQKHTLDEEDISQSNQLIFMFFNLFFMNSAVLDVHYNDDSIDDGVYIDIYYDKEQKQARLKGIEMSQGQFWQAITSNRLPKFN